MRPGQGRRSPYPWELGRRSAWRCHHYDPGRAGWVNADHVEVPRAAAEMFHERGIGVALAGRAEPAKAQMAFSDKVGRHSASMTGPLRPVRRPRHECRMVDVIGVVFEVARTSR